MKELIRKSKISKIFMRKVCILLHTIKRKFCISLKKFFQIFPINKELLLSKLERKLKFVILNFLDFIFLIIMFSLYFFFIFN